MVKRTKTKNDKPWPDSWVVTFEYQLPNGIKLVSRKFDFTLKGKPRTWYQFSRHVLNNDNGREWIDAFYIYPMGGFCSWPVDQIDKVRPHVIPKAHKKGRGK